MGASQRRKGVNAERELVHLLNDRGILCRRVPLSGSMAGYKDDLIIGPGFHAEVKIRASINALLYDALTHVNIAFVRGGGKPWLAVLDVDFFLAMLRYYLAGNEGAEWHRKAGEGGKDD